MIRLGRRGVLLLPLLAAACADDGEAEVAPPAAPGRDVQPLRFDYLPPIGLNVRRLEVVDRDVMTAAGELLPGPAVTETLFNMARDRIQTRGPNGTATFRILSASVSRRRDTLTAALSVRLEVANDFGSGFIEARGGVSRSERSGDPIAAGYELLKSAMDDLNVEFEYQIRNKLRDWIYGERPVRPPVTEPAAPAEPPVPPVNGPIDLSPGR